MEKQFSTEEYNRLCNEMARNSDNSFRLLTATMTLCAAAIGYGIQNLDKLNPYLFFIPFLITSPALLLLSSLARSIYRIGTYIMVFMEDQHTNFYWENRLMDLHNPPLLQGTPRLKISQTAMFTIIFIICYFCFLSSPQTVEPGHYLWFAFSVLVNVFCLYSYFRSTSNAVKHFFIKSWKDVRAQEPSRYDFIPLNDIIQLASAKRKCIFLDYDGTLVPIEKTPEAAIPSKQLLALIQQIGSLNNTSTYIISGRPANFLEKWFGTLNVTLVAEHGALIKKPNCVWSDRVQEGTDWKLAIRSIMENFTADHEGSFIEEKKYSMALHYRNAVRFGTERAIEEITTILEKSIDGSLVLLRGKKVIEIKHRKTSKGDVAAAILETENPELVLALGDDVTDEDLFRALDRNAITVKIGNDNKESAAKYIFQSQEMVPDFLKLLIRSWG